MCFDKNEIYFESEIGPELDFLAGFLKNKSPNTMDIIRFAKMLKSSNRAIADGAVMIFNKKFYKKGTNTNKQKICIFCSKMIRIKK